MSLPAASRVIIEKYYNRLTLDFDTNKRIQRGPVRGISLKLQEEERERRMDFIPDESALNTAAIEVDADTADMLKEIGLGSLPGISIAKVGWAVAGHWAWSGTGLSGATAGAPG